MKTEPVPTPPIYTNPLVAGSGAMFITPEAMMAYCQTQITGLDKQVQEYFDKQQKTAAAQKALGDIQNSIPPRDGDGDIKNLSDAQKATIKNKIEQAKQAYTDAGLPTDDLDWLEAKLTTTGGGAAGDSIISSQELDSCDQKIKNLQSDLGTTSQLDLIAMQELMSKRQSAIQLTTNLMSSFNDSAKSVIGNIK